MVIARRELNRVARQAEAAADVAAQRSDGAGRAEPAKATT
jgi:hypothetical protein